MRCRNPVMLRATESTSNSPHPYKHRAMHTLNAPPPRVTVHNQACRHGHNNLTQAQTGIVKDYHVIRCPSNAAAYAYVGGWHHSMQRADLRCNPIFRFHFTPDVGRAPTTAASLMTSMTLKWASVFTRVGHAARFLISGELVLFASLVQKPNPVIFTTNLLISISWESMSV